MKAALVVQVGFGFSLSLVGRCVSLALDDDPGQGSEGSGDYRGQWPRLPRSWVESIVTSTPNLRGLHWVKREVVDTSTTTTTTHTFEMTSHPTIVTTTIIRLITTKLPTVTSAESTTTQRGSGTPVTVPTVAANLTSFTTTRTTRTSLKTYTPVSSEGAAVQNPFADPVNILGAALGAAAAAIFQI